MQAQSSRKSEIYAPTKATERKRRKTEDLFCFVFVVVVVVWLVDWLVFCIEPYLASNYTKILADRRYKSTGSQKVNEEHKTITERTENKL